MIKVLIVEDDPMVMEINKSYLDGNTVFEVVDCAKDGMEAYKKLIKNQEIDLVLADIFMPKTSGVDLIKMARRKNISVDFIFITASKEIEDLNIAMQYGAYDYLVKPFTYERFYKTLNKFRAHFEVKQGMVSKDIDQSYIDQLMQKKEMDLEEDHFPKGLQKDTFERILIYIKAASGDEFTLQKMSIDLEITTVTLRKYMTYMEKVSIVSLRKEYGDIGRPKAIYKRILKRI